MPDSKKRSILSAVGSTNRKEEEEDKASTWEKLKKRSSTSGFGFRVTLGSFKRRGKPPVKVQFETKLRKFKGKNEAGAPLRIYKRAHKQTAANKGLRNRTRLHTGFRIRF